MSDNKNDNRKMPRLFSSDVNDVRVNNFWEKSSAGIDGLKLGAGFEQDC